MNAKIEQGLNFAIDRDSRCRRLEQLQEGLSDMDMTKSGL